MARKEEKAFSFVGMAERSKKPRKTGITEIRDMQIGLRQLQDLCEVAGDYIDILKTACASQRLENRELVKKKIDLCRQYGIEVSTGGFLERVVLQGPQTVVKFMEEAKDLGFTHVEISTGLLILPLEHKLELIKLANEYGLHAKPEVAMAYGITAETKVTVKPDKLLHEIEKCLEAGAHIVTIESEGITENVKEWNEDVVYRILSSFDMKSLLFEAADPLVFSWYIKNFGSEINLFVDHSQILFCEAVRTGAWGHDDTWGRVATFIRP